MPTCNICGQAIEFRYIGAVCTPIHPHGGCSGSSASGTYGSMPWRIRYSYESFVNPNASCPVCGERVFFYQSILGGRVFFDELGPPWPKHPCTDQSVDRAKGILKTGVYQWQTAG